MSYSMCRRDECSRTGRTDEMDYNEFDDYGTGFEEAAERKYEEMIDAQVREIIERCACESAGTQEATNALLRSRCSRCGWQ